MANVLSGLVWKVDTVGIVSETPITIRKAVLLPNAASDAALFHYWNPAPPGTGDINSTAGAQTATVTSTATIASTGNFEATEVAVGDIINITNSSTGNNTGPVVVITRTDDNTIVTSGGLTNEDNKIYSWDIYNGHLALHLPAGSSDTSPTTLDFGPGGLSLPNLALYTRSTSAVVHLYIG